MSKYVDEQGTWEAKLGPAGEFLSGVLIVPSPQFEVARAAQLVPPEPPEIAAAKAVLAKSMATPDEMLAVLKVIGKRVGLV